MRSLVSLVLTMFVANITAQKYADVEIRGISDPTVIIDYGEGAEKHGWTAKNHTKDDGTKFTGFIDVLTYFEDKGWELLEWSANFESNVSIRVYLFKLPRADTENDWRSEGITEGEGNQGSITGSPDSDNYLDGLGGRGIHFSLTGRSPLSLPKPEYNVQEDGKVVVKIRVNRDGIVTYAEAGAQGTSTLNKELLEAARKAALKARFNRSADSPFTQQGTITYHFVLQ